MKKYKIGNKIITADSATKALEIHKLLDSKVEDGTAKDIVEDLKSRFPGIQLKTTSMGGNNRHHILVEVVSYANNNENSVRNYLKHLADKYKSTHSSVVSHSNEIYIQDSKVKDVRWDELERAIFNEYDGEPHSDIGYDNNLKGFSSRTDASKCADFLEKKFPSLDFNVVNHNGWEIWVKGNIRDSISDAYYSEYDKKDKEFVKMALSEMKRYERNWHGMSSQDKRNVGCTLEELRKRIKELEAVKDSISDESIDELSEEEKKAIEDYRKAIEGTTDPKLLELFAHILKEETEHLEELQNAKEGEFEDSVKDLER